MCTLESVDPFFFFGIQLAPLAFPYNGNAGILEGVVDASVMVINLKGLVGICCSMSHDPVF